MHPQDWRKYLAELLGTFLLIFFGAGAVIIGQTFGASDLLAVAVAHGLAIMVGVYAFAHISGAHFNPAVSIAMMATKKMRVMEGISYIVSQLLGAALAALALKLIFVDLLVTEFGVPSLMGGLTPVSGIIVEAILTFVLVLVIFSVAVDQQNTRSNIAGVAIGSAILLGLLVGGPLTGGAMNPARWFGPAIISNVWTNWYVYLVGPMLGALLAAALYQLVYLRRK